MSIADDKGRVLLKTGSNVSVTGDAIINNRKRKLIPAYELEVKGTWTGKRFSPVLYNVASSRRNKHFHAVPPNCFHPVATMSAHEALQF